MSAPPDWRRLMAAERAANHARPERDDSATAEHHAAADRSGLPQPRRIGGEWVDGGPERWEVGEP